MQIERNVQKAYFLKVFNLNLVFSARFFFFFCFSIRNQPLYMLHFPFLFMYDYGTVISYD